MLQELQFFKKSLFLVVLYVSNFQVLTFIDRDFYRDTWDISMFEMHVLEIVGRHSFMGGVEALKSSPSLEIKRR